MKWQCCPIQSDKSQLANPRCEAKSDSEGLPAASWEEPLTLAAIAQMVSRSRSTPYRANRAATLTTAQQ
jgi:hypothetical protein